MLCQTMNRLHRWDRLLRIMCPIFHHKLLAYSILLVTCSYRKDIATDMANNDVFEKTAVLLSVTILPVAYNSERYIFLSFVSHLKAIDLVFL